MTARDVYLSQFDKGTAFFAVLHIESLTQVQVPSFR